MLLIPLIQIVRPKHRWAILYQLFSRLSSEIQRKLGKSKCELDLLHFSGSSVRRATQTSLHSNAKHPYRQFSSLIQFKVLFICKWSILPHCNLGPKQLAAVMRLKKKIICLLRDNLSKVSKGNVEIGYFCVCWQLSLSQSDYCSMIFLFKL